MIMGPQGTTSQDRFLELKVHCGPKYPDVYVARSFISPAHRPPPLQYLEIEDQPVDLRNARPSFAPQQRCCARRSEAALCDSHLLCPLPNSAPDVRFVTAVAYNFVEAGGKVNLAKVKTMGGWRRGMTISSMLAVRCRC